MTNHTHEIPGSPADNPLPRGSECDDDVLLPLLGVPFEPVDADGTGNPLRSLPCNENGKVLLPLLGDEDEAPAPGNSDTNPPTNEYQAMNNCYYAASFVDLLGNLVVVKAWRTERGLRFSWLKMSHFESLPGLRDHSNSIKLWGIIDGDVESRELLVTIYHVNAAILKKGYMHRLIASMIKHHTNSTTISLPKFDDLQAYIAWNTRA